MKNKLIIIVILLIFTISCLLINNIFASTETNKKLLNELYYENSEDAFFFSNITDSIINNKINIYAINWLIKISEITHVDFNNRFISYTEKYFSSSSNHNITINKSKDINDLLNFLTTMKKIKGDIRDKAYFIETIKTVLEEKNWLYSNEDDYDEIVYKTQILNLALQTFDTLGEVPENIKSNILQTSKSFIDNPAYFNTDNKNIKRNLIDLEIIVLKSLIILDKYTDENVLEIVKTKENWITKQAEYLNEELSMSVNYSNFDLIFINDCIININSVSEFIGQPIELEVKYADNLTDDLIRESYLKDAQIAFKIIKVNKILGNEIDKNTIEFIKHNLSYWLFEQTPAADLKELYYSIHLANANNIRYDAEKINHFIDRYKNSKIVQDIYYRILIKNMLSKPISISEPSMQAIAEDTYNFDKNSLENKYYLLHLFNILNLSSNYISDIIEEFKNENFESLIENSTYETDIYYLTKIAKLLNVTIESNFLESEISKFKHTDGLYCLERKGKFSNIGSTYRIIEIKLKNNINIEKDQELQIKRELSNFKGTHGGYFYTKMGNDINNNNYLNFSFASFYYGVILSDFDIEN